MSLVKKNRINHFRKNKQNIKKRQKEQGEQLRRLGPTKKRSPEVAPAAGAGATPQQRPS
jgi:hypothetical protein